MIRRLEKASYRWLLVTVGQTVRYYQGSIDRTNERKARSAEEEREEEEREKEEEEESLAMPGEKKRRGK